MAIKKRNKNRKKFFAISLTLVLSIAVLSFVFKNDPIPHQNIVDTKISLYSDKNITPKAIETNPEFKNIVFDTAPTKNTFPFVSQIAAVVRSIRATITPIKEDVIPKELGSWIWTPIMQMTPDYTESILSEAKANRVNVMYLSIDSYLDIFTMKKGTERERQKRLFSRKVEDFIVRANYKGIEVDAEAGWRNWAEDDNIYKAYAIINYVKSFNATHSNKFRGFQYDVEPYLLERYQKNKVSVLSNFVELVDKTEYFLKDSDLTFSVVIPDFYDEKDEFTPNFSYNGEKESTFKHLLNILDKKEGSSIIIMSYRNFAEGQDGSIEVSRNEIQTADKGNHKTKIIIAQETGDFLPSYITFHNTSKRYLYSELEKINDTFSSHSSFGGIAIHYVNTFLALR